MHQIQIKRAYDPAASADGFRILVDRLWPRGVSKERLRLDAWAKGLAPSTALRKWFAHDPAKWTEFRKRYRAELRAAHAADQVRELLGSAKRNESVTLVYGAKDREHNEAIVLADLFNRAAAKEA